MNSKTINVSNKIKNISENHGTSTQGVIEKAINFYETKIFLKELNIAYAESKNINDDIWDYTLMDGLEKK